MQEIAAKKLVREALEKSFDKECFISLVKNILNEFDESKACHFGGYIKETFKPFIKTYERLGTYTDPDNKKVDILIVQLKENHSIERSRTSLRNFVSGHLKQRNNKDAALVAFVAPNKDDWRFSFVEMKYVFNEKGQIEEQLTHAKRHSFLVGKNENSHTAQSRFLQLLRNDEANPTLEEVEETFSVERVTKEFFERYRDLFLRLKESLDAIVKKSPRVKVELENKNVNTSDFSKKLLGQIVFLYFLQKKGWFGVKRHKEWGSGSKHFLRELFMKKHGDYTNFFNDILEPLFYEALSSERSDDYYRRFDCRIPFLNGGLFEAINNYDWVNIEIPLPDELFSNQNGTTRMDIDDGILDIFDRYNFTVKEDEPLEQEVAIDPEMLGKVFENLLDDKDRKPQGAYYTPRPIVHYMCQESLIDYLTTEMNNEIKREDIEKLIKFGEISVEHDAVYREKISKKVRYSGKYKTPKLPKSIESHAELIDERLKRIHVCDPAVGSGAFAVGMMNEITKARTALTPHVTSKKERSSYYLKRQTIQQCLYGVDINLGAVEIARLRLWLSLIVDEERRENIQPLPNLDYKIVQGNSLVELANVTSRYAERNKIVAGIKKKKDNIFDITSPNLKEKEKSEVKNMNKKLYEYDRKKGIELCKNEISKIKSQFKLLENKNLSKSDERKINGLETKIQEAQASTYNPAEHFEWEINFPEVFSDKGGFDIVIGNPPYVKKENLDQKTIKELEKHFAEKKNGKERAWSDDLYAHFIFQGARIAKDNGVVTYIANDSFIALKNKERVRRMLLKYNLLKLIRCPEQTFEATIYTAVFIMQKSKPLSQCYESGTFSHPEFSYEFSGLVPYDLVFNLPNQRFIFSSQILNIYKKLSCLSKICDYINILDTGIDSGNVRKNIFFQEKVKKKLHRLLQGKQIEKLGIFWDKPKTKYRYCDIHYEPKSQKGVGRRGMRSMHNEYWSFRGNRENHHQPERLLMRQTDDDLVVAYHNEKIHGQYYTDNTLFTILRKNPDVSLKYVGALLNSKLLNSLYHFLSSERGKTLAQIKIGLVNELPFKKENQEPVIKLVDKILAVTRSENYLENSAKQDEVKKYEEQIDQLVYKIYGLTSQERKIVESSENRFAEI